MSNKDLKQFRFAITGVIYAKSLEDAEDLAEEMAHMDGATCDPVTVEPLTEQPEVSTSVNFSASLVQKFWEAWTAGSYKGQRLGQAFYNFFHMHRMSDQAQLGQLYELDARKARAWIAAHTTPEN